MRILKGNEWRYLTDRDGAFVFESLKDTSDHPSQIMVWEAKFIYHDEEGNDYVIYLSSRDVLMNTIFVATLARSTRRRIEAGEIPPLHCHPLQLLRATGEQEKKQAKRENSCSGNQSANSQAIEHG